VKSAICHKLEPVTIIRPSHYRILLAGEDRVDKLYDYEITYLDF
jgi:hypothetical protein